jgi:Sulfatase-modifying factor enzyme 1/Concanavalin A-like lectin/glucanases superfamily/Divergent InlB B-repeat domain/Bacterial TSP3 repeat
MHTLNHWLKVTGLFSLLLIRVIGQPAFINDGLVAYYPFDGTVNDKSGFNRNPSMESKIDYTTDMAGRANSAARFVVDSQIVIPNFAEANENQHTVSFWIKTTSTQSKIITKDSGIGDSSSKNRQWILGLAAEGVGYGVFTTSGSPALKGGVSKLNYQPGRWNHIVQTWDGITVKLFINGSLSSSIAATGNLQPSTEPIRIGRDGYPLPSFAGDLDEVRIYNRSLPDMDVKALFDYESNSSGTISIKLIDIKTTSPVLLGFPDFIPESSVTLTDYSISKDETTFRIWTTVNDIAKSKLGWNLPLGTQGSGYADTNPDHPVTEVSPADVALWCNALSMVSGLDPCYLVWNEDYVLEPYTPENQQFAISRGIFWKQSANGYRLPTGNEWEIAARGGLASQRYPWGESSKVGRANWFVGAGQPNSTTQVGTYEANGYGLTDMAGNCWEFTWDDRLPPDGAVPTRISNVLVIRGGGWNSGWDPRISANYGWGVPLWHSSHSSGFRLAKGVHPVTDMAQLDSDGDGFDDRTEGIAGSNPYNPASTPKPLVIEVQPQSQSVILGGDVTFCVTMKGGETFSYQWQVDEQNIPGATLNCYTVNSTPPSMSGRRLRVIVSNNAGTITSETATLSVLAPVATGVINGSIDKGIGGAVLKKPLSGGYGRLEQMNLKIDPGLYRIETLVDSYSPCCADVDPLAGELYPFNVPGTLIDRKWEALPGTGLIKFSSRIQTDGSRYGVLISLYSRSSVTVRNVKLFRESDGVQLLQDPGLTGLSGFWHGNAFPVAGPGNTNNTVDFDLAIGQIETTPNQSAFSLGSQVSLKAIPTWPFQFSHWTVDGVTIGTANPLTFTVDSSKTVNAVFILKDADGDNLSDYEEALVGTDPNKPDTDGDGLGDAVEVNTRRTNPLNPDTDGDGYSDGIEVAKDGDPNNANIKPTGALAIFPAVDVEFYTVNGVKYQLEVSKDMIQWTPQGSPVVGNGGNQNHLVRVGEDPSFWRLKVAP